MYNIEKELVRIILNVVGVADYELKPNDDLEKVQGFTSIEFVQMLVDIEEFFEIEFDFEKLDFEFYRTYDFLLEYIKEKKVPETSGAEQGAGKEPEEDRADIPCRQKAKKWEAQRSIH